MVYALFNLTSGNVVKTSSEVIGEYEGYGVCKIDKLNVGDELYYTLIIESVVDGVAVQYQQGPNNHDYIPVIKLMQEQIMMNLELKKEIDKLKHHEEMIEAMDGAIHEIASEVWKEVE